MDGVQVQTLAWNTIQLGNTGYPPDSSTTRTPSREFSLSFVPRGSRNVKREWRTIHCAFGGIGLFSFAIEHTISMINMFIQHYGAGTTLAKKFTASLEVLQLELGCAGNPLWENFDEKDLLQPSAG
jgi:hypothetical protein